jgi:uncharacterized protein (TIGR02246 family)
MNISELKQFAARYTAAWCSQDAARVASFFAYDGSLTVNNGKPSVGPSAIAATAQHFMTAFPDMIITMDAIDKAGDRFIFRWTLTGTNNGPGGSGRPVRISGQEEWQLNTDGLIANSKGSFDEADYQRQTAIG